MRQRGFCQPIGAALHLRQFFFVRPQQNICLGDRRAAPAVGNERQDLPGRTLGHQTQFRHDHDGVRPQLPVGCLDEVHALRQRRDRHLFRLRVVTRRHFLLPPCDELLAVQDGRLRKDRRFHFFGLLLRPSLLAYLLAHFARVLVAEKIPDPDPHLPLPIVNSLQQRPRLDLFLLYEVPEVVNVI